MKVSYGKKKNPCTFTGVVKPAQEKDNFWYRAIKIQIEIQSRHMTESQGFVYHLLGTSLYSDLQEISIFITFCLYINSLSDIETPRALLL